MIKTKRQARKRKAQHISTSFSFSVRCLLGLRSSVRVIVLNKGFHNVGICLRSEEHQKVVQDRDTQVESLLSNRASIVSRSEEHWGKMRRTFEKPANSAP